MGARPDLDPMIPGSKEGKMEELANDVAGGGWERDATG